MKRFIGIILALCVLMIPSMAFAQQPIDYDFDLEAVIEVKDVEVGDQFMVDIVKSDDEAAFLTFRINGTFDVEKAELVAPVYTNRDLGVLTNQFDNEKGTFTFEGYDQRINGVTENVICSLLFKLKNHSIGCYYLFCALKIIIKIVIFKSENGNKRLFARFHCHLDIFKVFAVFL